MPCGTGFAAGFGRSRSSEVGPGEICEFGTGDTGCGFGAAGGAPGVSASAGASWVLPRGMEGVTTGSVLNGRGLRGDGALSSAAALGEVL